MKEIKRIKVERFYRTETKAKEVKEAVESIDRIDKELNVLNEKVAPYGNCVPMSEIVDNARRWNDFSDCSRDVVIEELNGCIDIINNKIRLHNEKDVKVKIIMGKDTGEVKVLKESIAKDFIDCGVAVLV